MQISLSWMCIYSKKKTLFSNLFSFVFINQFVQNMIINLNYFILLILVSFPSNELFAFESYLILVIIILINLELDKIECLSFKNATRYVLDFFFNYWFKKSIKPAKYLSGMNIFKILKLLKYNIVSTNI